MNGILTIPVQRLGAILLVLLCAAGAWLCPAGPAAAHASLVRADPADGAVVMTAPKSFTLTFSEPVSPLVLKLLRPDGGGIVLDRFALHDKTLDIEAPAGLGEGTHVLSWRIVSEDGHPVGGSMVFSVGAPGTGPMPASGETIDWSLRILIWTGKTALHLGLFIGAGGAFFINWIGARTASASRAACWSLCAGLAGATLSIGLQGLDALGQPLMDITAATTWKTGFSTRYGLTALIAIPAFASAALSLRSEGASGKVLSLFSLLAVGLALAASGHASTAHPQWLARAAVFLHGIGIAFWAGSLIPVGAAFASQAPDAITVLRHFSRVIPFAILPLVAAGVLLAAMQVQSPGALWTTAYGQVLLVKTALLVALFLLAAINRFRLTEPAARGDGPATLRLRRSIGVEVLLVLTIFGVAAMWRFTPPPRALAEAAAAAVSVHIHTGKVMAEVTVTPGRAGPASASVTLMKGDFGPLEAKGVTLVLSNPAAGIERIKRTATPSGGGAWQVDGLSLPVPGPWNVRLDILISDFEMVKIEDRIEVRP